MGRCRHNVKDTKNKQKLKKTTTTKNRSSACLSVHHGYAVPMKVRGGH